MLRRSVCLGCRRSNGVSAWSNCAHFCAHPAHRSIARDYPPRRAERPQDFEDSPNRNPAQNCCAAGRWFESTRPDPISFNSPKIKGLTWPYAKNGGIALRGLRQQWDKPQNKITYGPVIHTFVDGFPDAPRPEGQAQPKQTVRFLAYRAGQCELPYSSGCLSYQNKR